MTRISSRALAVTAALAATAALTGCGSSKAPAHTTTTAVASASGVPGTPSTHTPTVQAAVPSHQPEHGSARALNPCSLISRAKAQSLSPTRVTSTIEAPLGPTCIYRLRGGPGQVTLSLHGDGLPVVLAQMSARRTVVVRGRRGYCGRVGLSTLVVGLGAGRYLSVSAPCPLAGRYADAALAALRA